MESMRITSVDDAIKDKLSIYDDYVNHKLKYANYVVRTDRIEDIMRSFLIQYCPMANELSVNNANISVKELIEYCLPEYPRMITTVKCIFSFFYIVSIMTNIAYPAVRTSFLPYCLENFKGIDILLLTEYKNDFFLYFELDMQKKYEVINVVMGAFDVLLCLTDETNTIQYCIHMTDEAYSMDEMCHIVDYREKDDILPILNHICKSDATIFHQMD